MVTPVDRTAVVSDTTRLLTCVDSASTRSHVHDLRSAETLEVLTADGKPVHTSGKVGRLGSAWQRVHVNKHFRHFPRIGSVAEAADAGYVVQFTRSGVTFLDGRTGVVKGRGTRIGNLFYIDHRSIAPPTSPADATAAISTDIAGPLRHASLADSVVVQRDVRSGIVSMTPVCETCAVASTRPAPNRLDTWHSRFHVADSHIKKLVRGGHVEGVTKQR